VVHLFGTTPILLSPQAKHPHKTNNHGTAWSKSPGYLDSFQSSFVHQAGTLATGRVLVAEETYR
jgi:hypothetical protein